jgi:hypothetical protein
MSLGDYTKCDLCASTAKLDITALEKQLTAYLIMLADEIRNLLSPHRDINTNFKDAVSSFSSTGSRSLTLLSKSFSETAELLHTIQKSYNRKIECVNLLNQEKLNDKLDKTSC